MFDWSSLELWILKWHCQCCTNKRPNQCCLEFPQQVHRLIIWEGTDLTHHLLTLIMAETCEWKNNAMEEEETTGIIEKEIQETDTLNEIIVIEIHENETQDHLIEIVIQEILGAIQETLEVNQEIHETHVTEVVHHEDLARKCQDILLRSLQPSLLRTPKKPSLSCKSYN